MKEDMHLVLLGMNVFVEYGYLVVNCYLLNCTQMVESMLLFDVVFFLCFHNCHLFKNFIN